MILEDQKVVGDVMVAVMDVGGGETGTRTSRHQDHKVQRVRDRTTTLAAARESVSRLYNTLARLYNRFYILENLPVVMDVVGDVMVAVMDVDGGVMVSHRHTKIHHTDRSLIRFGCTNQAWLGTLAVGRRDLRHN